MNYHELVCLCVFSLDRELTDLKRRRSSLMASLKGPSVEVVRPQKAGEEKINRLFLLDIFCSPL